MEGGGHHIQLPAPSDELGGCRKQLVDNTIGALGSLLGSPLGEHLKLAVCILLTVGTASQTFLKCMYVCTQ